MTKMTVLLAILIAAPLGAEPSRDSAGVVVELKGHVFWRAKAGAPPQPLTDIHKKFSVGEGLRCGPDGSVTVLLNNGQKQLGPSETWFTITWAPIGAQTEMMAKSGDVLSGYGRPGASTRGGDDFLLAPVHGSSVVPATFTIRWTPVADSVTFKLRAGERTIWQDTVNDGAGGVLESAAAREAIGTFSASAGADSLTLVVSSKGGRGEATFSALSAAQQSELETEMKFWDGQDSSFLRHIGRASVFAKRRVFAEAASEYELALAESPDSADLLMATIHAERRAGNAVRARRLEARVPPGAGMP